MPTYQYACTTADCGNRFEQVQSFTDPAITACPVCAGPVRKVFSAVGVVFKGSGFYRTDSRSSTNSSTAAKSGEGAKSSESAKTSSDSGSSRSSASASGSSAKTAASSPSKAAAAS